MVCDQVDSLPNPYSRPGKRGPKGEPGQRGEIGPCPNVEALTSQLSDLQQESATLKNKLALLEQSLLDVKAMEVELQETQKKVTILQTSLGVLQEESIITKAKLTKLDQPRKQEHLPLPLDCSEVTERAFGVYQLRPFNVSAGSISVFCDKGWIGIQKRINGSVDFYRGWQEYVDGFGNLKGEFWLGLANIHQLTTKYNMMLRVDLEDRDGNTAYAQYSTFKVAGSGDNYRLTIGGYSGTAGDSMSGIHSLNNMMFSTLDRDNDEAVANCAIRHHGAWWCKYCQRSNLNGDYSVAEEWSGGIGKTTGMD